MRPTRAQAVASIRASSLHRRVDGLRQIRLGRSLADKRLDECRCGFGSNLADAGERLVLDLGNSLLGGRELARKLLLGLLAAAIDVGLQLVARLLRNAVGLVTRFRKRLLVGGDGGVAFLVQAICLGEVARDPVAPILEDAAETPAAPPCS